MLIDSEMECLDEIYVYALYAIYERETRSSQTRHKINGANKSSETEAAKRFKSVLQGDIEAVPSFRKLAHKNIGKRQRMRERWGARIYVLINISDTQFSTLP